MPAKRLKSSLKKLIYTGDRTSYTMPDGSSLPLVWGKEIEVDAEIPFIKRLIKKKLLAIAEQAIDKVLEG